MVQRINAVLLGIFLMAAMLIAGCIGEEEIIGAKDGDSVKVHYTGTLEDGTEFDSSIGGEPLAFVLGSGQLIPGFEQAITGMVVGEKKTVTIPAAEAYGLYRNELVSEVERDRFPEDVELEAGQLFQMTLPDGRPVIVTVMEVTETAVTIDANHFLAGKDLTFEIEIIEIN